MSLFSDPVDRYFVGKLLAGLLGITFAARALRVLMVERTSFSLEMIRYTILATACFALFQYIETRRQRRTTQRA